MPFCISAIILYMKPSLWLVGLIGIILMQASCSSSGGGAAALTLVIDEPSQYETNFAELRDLYVIGSYSGTVTTPGDIRIQLYRGSSATGELVRDIQSQVDPETGVTPESSLNLDYASGSDYGITMVPDLVEVPGGFLDPNNKVVVTTDYFAGVILGGATKDFDTTYTDSDGNPLEDLTAGTYTIVVWGVNGDVEGLHVTKEITFGLTHASLGRFSPASTLEKLTAFTRANDYRAYFNRFPGYFLYEGNLYEIKDRFMPNNSIEVVNDLTGTTIDTVAAAYNDLLIYNVRATSATNTVETAALVRYELTESERSVFHYYDIGEPTITYVNGDAASVTVDGAYATFATDDRLVLPRVEIQDAGTTLGDNLYYVDDTTPTELDLDVSDGVTVGTTDVFSVFGVVRPIPSTVTAGTHNYEFSIDDRIAQIAYTITDAGGATVETATRDVELERSYDDTNRTSLSGSVYEFKHEFTIDDGAGTYTVALIGLDTLGAEVTGTAESFTVVVE